MPSKKKKNKQKNDEKLPQNIVDTIPYKNVYSNGIIEVSTGFFSQSYIIPDVNFKTATEEEQWRLAEDFYKFMNSFDAGTDMEITLYNKTIDQEAFQEKVFIPMRADDLNEYREEYNEMLSEKMLGAKNNLETNKILTITIQAEDIMEANEKFAQINGVVIDNMTTMTKYGTAPMPLIERLDMLNSIMKGDQARPVYQTRMIDGHESESFSLENCAKQGITTKEIIAPDSFEFSNKTARIGNRYMRSLYVSAYPTYISGTILTDFADIPANMLVSVYYTPYDQGEAIKMVRQQSVNINSEVIDSEKNAAKNGVYGDAAVGSSLNNAKEEVQELTDRMTKDNVKLFNVTFIFTLFADSEEELDAYEEQLHLIGNKNLITIQALNYQQEDGFASALPLGNNKLSVSRLMSSHSIASIIPFDVKEISQDSGMYYGQNAVSRNMILYDRNSDINPCGCILGMPGAGKSFSAKREMINVLLNTDDEIYVIDPEREYSPLTEAFHGSTIELAIGSSNHINPFDLNLENTDDSGDPIKIKSDFIETIVEIMVGGRFGLSPIEKSIIDRSVNNIYEPYVQRLHRLHKNQDIDSAPTLQDFYNDLCNQPQMEAQNLALSLERFVNGSQDVFNHRTNVDISNRFTVYDIKDIGAGLKELGLQIALDNIWNKMIENFDHGKRTWFYIDEFYLMMQKPTSAAYIAEIWKRARKWNGTPCAITQNVEDMLKSEDARTIINNSSFVMMLGQSPINRQQLSSMMNISPEEQKYISSAKPGTGIIHIGDNNIPVVDEFPKDTRLYQIMTTNPEEKMNAKRIDQNS